MGQSYMPTKEIVVIRDLWLGEGNVLPTVPVMNTDFAHWEPETDGSYSAAALFYALTYRHILTADADLALDRAKSSEGAHGRTLLLAHTMVEAARRADTFGPQLRRISLNDINNPLFFENEKGQSKGFYFKTHGLRAELSRHCWELGQCALTWIKPARIIPSPLNSMLLFPRRADNRAQLDKVV